MPNGNNAINHITYSTQTLYLMNSPECPVPNVTIKLAYTSKPKEQYKRFKNCFLNKIKNELKRRISKRGLYKYE